MKLLKNKKSLTSIATILIALALIAGSTMAWFVISGNAAAGTVEAGTFDMKTESVFNDVQNALPGFIYPAALTDCGFIENTGTVNLVVSLAADPTVTRRYTVDTTKPDADWKTGPQLFGYVQKPGDMTVADNDGVPGAVLTGVAIPPTANNIKALTVDNSAILYNDSYDYDGNWYLMLTPGTKIDIAVIVDLKTNASPKNITDFSDPATCLYLDNTYNNCKVEFGSEWIATQFDPAEAIADIFGLTPDANGDVLYADLSNTDFDVDMTDPSNPVLTPESYTLQWLMNVGGEADIILD